MSDLPAPPLGALDFDLEGFDLFAGIDVDIQAAVLDATINFDATLFTEPIISSVTVPQTVIPPVSTSLETKAVSSASAKMAQLKARLSKHNKEIGPSMAPAPVAQTIAPLPATAILVPPDNLRAMPTAIPKTDCGSPTQISLAPQVSPMGLEPTKARTSGIFSLIASSILSPDLVLGGPKTSEQRKSIPIYKSAQPSFPGFLNSSTEDVFDFGDDDPEETGEKLKLDEDSDWEPDALNTSNGDKENFASEYTRRSGYGPKQSEPEKPSKEVKKAESNMPERDKARQETLEFSEQLMQRINKSLSTDFAVVAQCKDIQCAIDSVKKNGGDADRPPLPRLIIRMSKKTNDDSRRRSKKKRHYSDEDTTDEEDDWYGEKPKKRRGRNPKCESRSENTYSSRLVDPFILEQKRKESQVDTQAMSMKDRIMRKWRQDNVGTDIEIPETARGVEGQVEVKSLWRIVGEYRPVDVRERLDKMKPCEGEIARETFLVLKSELHSSDCALWRVDSMSLLHKFPSFLGKSEDGELKLLYKRSTTYSGWCEQLQSNYMVVEVRPVRSSNVNNRGEVIVEPLIPLVELLPAISEGAKEMFRARSSNKNEADDQLEAQKFIRGDGVTNSLSKLFKSMLNGAPMFDYFLKSQINKDLSNDSGELLDNIENLLKELQYIISDCVSFPSEFENQLRRYSLSQVIDCESKENNCQMCGEAPVTNTFQLYNLAHDTENRDENNNDLEEDLPAMDYHTCSECCKLAQWQHSLVHFRSSLTGRIEDRLLDATYEMLSRSPEQILEALPHNHTWLKEVALTHTDTWEQIIRLEETEDNGEDESATDPPSATPETPAAVSAIQNIQSASPAPPAAPVAVALSLPSGFSIASLLHT